MSVGRRTSSFPPTSAPTYRPIFPYRDVFGNRCSRIVAPAGQMRLSADGMNASIGSVALLVLAIRDREIFIILLVI